MKGDGSSKLKKIAVAVIGGLVLLLGVVTIPYPGPGWLIVFAGLGILSSEFEWAKSILVTLRARYDAWQAWLKKQPLAVKAIFWILTCAIVIITIWLLNGYGILNSLLRLDMDWLRSPLVN